jgi:hypothetical protein
MSEHPAEHASALPVGAGQEQVHLLVTRLELDIIARALQTLAGNIDLTRRVVAAREAADHR